MRHYHLPTECPWGLGTLAYLARQGHAEDNIWPGYATAIVLELYAKEKSKEKSEESEESEELFVRVLRNGTPLRLKVCDHQALCPVSTLQRLAQASSPCPPVEAFQVPWAWPLAALSAALTAFAAWPRSRSGLARSLL